MAVGEFDLYKVATGKVVFLAACYAADLTAVFQFHAVAFTVGGGDGALLCIAQLFIKLVISLVEVIRYMQLFVFEPLKVEHSVAVANLSEQAT